MFKLLLEGLPDAVLIVSSDGHIQALNKLAEALFGYEHGALLGRSVEELIPESLREAHTKHRVTFSQKPRSRPMGGAGLLLGRRADGSDFPVEISLAPIELDSSVGVLAVIRDVTERRRAEREALLREQRIHTLMQLAQIGTWELDVLHDKRTYSPELLSLLGLTEAHVNKDAFYNAVYPDDQELVRQATQRAIQEGTPYRITLRIASVDRGIRNFETRVFPDRDELGRVVRLRGVAMDVTDRMRIEESLRRSERNFRRLIEGAPDAVLVSRGGLFLFGNARAAELFGRESPQHLLGESFFSFSPSEDLVRFIAQLEELERLEAPEVPVLASWRLERKDGSSRDVEAASISISWDDHPAVLTTIRDVTVQKQLQLQLATSDRLASLGALAAGIAHEINNPLSAVLGNLDLLATGFLEQRISSEMTSALKETQEAIQQVKAIAQDLKALSHPNEEPTSPIDVHASLESCLRMARNELRYKARIVTSFSKVPPVLANTGRLGQVFLNLLLNAAQSFPENNVEQNKLCISTSLHTDGRVLVELQDTGVGISPKNLPKLFTPFFTTKAPGIGTGLGLALCRRILSALGGEIQVESELGKGTLVKVFLQAAAQRPFHAPAPSDLTAPRRGRVLVVDNDPLVGGAIQRVLQRQHEVLFLTKAQEALSRIQAGEQFDVILCDLQMPQMSGQELYQSLREGAPRLAERVIFLTGGGPPEAGIERPLIEKPFAVSALRSAINEVLRTSPPISH